MPYGKQPEVETEPVGGVATLSWEEGKLRFYPEDRLPSDQYAMIRWQGFNWSRPEECFIAAYTPSRHMFLEESHRIGDLQEDDLSMEERAEVRRQRYEQYQANAAQRGNEARDKVRAIVQAIPFGQPILIGHHSERGHRAAIKRMENGQRKAVEEWGKSSYWQHRAERTLARIKRRERPDAIYRRLVSLRKELAKMEKQAKEYRTRTEASERWYDLWLWFLEGRIAFEEALYQASGGIPAEREGAPAIEVGGAILAWGKWREVKRVNKVTITVPNDYGYTHKIRLDEIRGIKSRAEWEGLKG